MFITDVHTHCVIASICRVHSCVLHPSWLCYTETESLHQSDLVSLITSHRYIKASPYIICLSLCQRTQICRVQRMFVKHTDMQSAEDIYKTTDMQSAEGYLYLYISILQPISDSRAASPSSHQLIWAHLNMQQRLWAEQMMITSDGFLSSMTLHNLKCPPSPAGLDVLTSVRGGNHTA